MSERESMGCPNRDCDHTGDFTEVVWGDTGHGLGVWIRCDCGAAGPFALLSDALSDVGAAEAEAWRLWNAMPREPLRWTTDGPVLDGWHWLRVGCGEPRIAWMSAGNDLPPLVEIAGPIPLPIDPDDEPRPSLRDEAAAVLAQLDELASVWGDEGVFRRCRDRLRTAITLRDAR